MKRSKTGFWIRCCSAAGVLLACEAVGADTNKPGNGPKDKPLQQGLVAHYYRDPINWNGAWPDKSNLPKDSPVRHTFTAYAYSRVEPLINHHFINDGWFSIRWTGTVDLSATARVKGTNDSPEVVFSIWADDGCRLFVDGVKLIDSWIACNEGSPDSLRTGSPIKLADGPHRIVVEYFQGQSLEKNDQDPIKLYWTCPGRAVEKPQILPAAYLSHTDDDMLTAAR